MKRLLTSLMILLAASFESRAGQPGLHREGELWVETTNGSEAAEGADALKIVSAGNVTVRGANQSRIVYTLRRSVRARDEAQAREMLQEASVNLRRQGTFTRLIVDDAAGPVELVVTAPRRLGNLVIGVDAGNIEVIDIAGRITAQTGGGNVHVSRVRGDVDLQSAGGNVRMGEVGGSAKAFTAGGDIAAALIGGEARLQTEGGQITVQKVAGNIRASTAGGSIHIEQAGGTVVASTAGGEIDIGRAGGLVTAHNAGGGPIVVESANGGVRCDNASGAIKVGSLNGVLRLSTSSGSVVAQLQGNRLLSDSYVSTGSGDITVVIPAEVGLTIRARNEGATRKQSIVSDFPGMNVHLEGVAVTARGAVNGGGPLLRIEGNGGMIWIKKK